MGHRAVVLFLAALFLGPISTSDLRAQTASWVPAAAPASDFTLSVQNIMQGTEHVGQAPVAVSWTDDSRWIYFRWLPGGGDWHENRSLYRVSRDGGTPEQVDDAEADSLAIHFARGAISPDRRWRASTMGGDLYLVDRRSLEVRRLTDTNQSVSSPSFSVDGRKIFYRSGQNLFARDREDGAVQQLTDIRSGPEPRDPADPTGHKAFLDAQQLELFEHIRVDSIRAARLEEARERREAGEPEPFYLNSGERVQGLVVDPSGRWVVATLSKPAQNTKGTMVPDWVTDSGYTEELNVRTKVGDNQSVTRAVYIDVATGESKELDVTDPSQGEETSDGEADEGARADPSTTEESVRDGTTDAESKDDPAGRPTSNHPDLAQLRFIGWSDDGSHGLVMAVDFDFKDWRLYGVEGATGDLTLLYELHDEAWVGGPCFGCIGFIPETDRAYYVAEETGYSHLYAVNADGSDPEALTSGDWEVLGVSIPEQRNRFHLRTSESSPFEAHAYWMDFDGGNRSALTAGEGSYAVTPSPDGRRMAVIHSVANHPPELYVAEQRQGANLEQVTTSPTQEWSSFPWVKPEIVRFAAEDGQQVPGRIYRPEDVGAESNGAAVIFVHGAGYLHNVHTWWSSYFREYMFHHFLAASGYTVLDIDYRGSAGYGRDWRTGIYRWMGGKDLSDHVDGARYLVAEEGIDPGRIGLYGGSYGGFITLMALFTEPDVFEAGAALRSVTDWAHYNHWYTSRILNLPDDDEEAYEKSSPIYFAEGLEGHLLIAHGMVDTNVHFSDVVRLAQRLIELGKEDWEMAVYPVENHGFVEPSSWTDEYRRIFELFEKSIGGN